MSRAGPALTPVSYMILGLVARDGPSTPYELKAAASRGIARLWQFPHSQLYSETTRLAQAGLLTEERETEGRRRRRYRITRAGRDALRDWLREPWQEPAQVRNLAVLQLFFSQFAGSEHLVELARTQAESHRARLTAAREAEKRLLERGDRPQQLAVLEYAMRHDRMAVDFWNRIAAEPPRPPA